MWLKKNNLMGKTIEEEFEEYESSSDSALIGKNPNTTNKKTS